MNKTDLMLLLSLFSAVAVFSVPLAAPLITAFVAGILVGQGRHPPP
jgi:hypothetical protein